MLDAVQYGMLVDMHMHDEQDPAIVHLSETIKKSSQAPLNLDLEHYIH